MENKEEFVYTYSAKEREEVERIRSKYQPEDMDTVARIKALDASVTTKANTVSIVVGIIGTLILGLGMSCCMVWSDSYFLAGIILGLIGILLVCVAYPIHNLVLKKERERIAPVILKLTEEIIK